MENHGFPLIGTHTIFLQTRSLLMKNNDGMTKSAQTQYVYLDFDGEITSYNGEILTIGHVVVEDSKLTAEAIRAIVGSLNDLYIGRDVIFVTERPDAIAYSTVYVGKSDSFSKYGDFLGISETIDTGNQIKNDNAFVFADASFSNEDIVSVIAHETGHLLGEKHETPIGGISDYAATFYENNVLNDYKATADSLGTQSTGFTYKGNISAYGSGINTGDRDWFYFTAGTTGKVTLNIDSAQAQVTYYLNGKYSYCYNTQPLTVNVTKGSTYYFEVSSRTAAYGFSYSVTGAFSGGGGGSGHKPDLMFYKPSGWSSSAVIHQTAGRSHTKLDSTAKSYLDVAILNNGKGNASSAIANVSIDGKVHTSFIVTALTSRYYASKTNLDLGVLSAGKHTITVSIDPSGTLKETNTKNNVLNKTVTVRDTTPPGKVASCSAYQDKYNAVLSWNAATDNVKVGKYQISYRQTGSAAKTATAATTSFTVKNLKPGTYHYTVTAIDSSKNRGAASDSYQITIKDVTAPGTVSVSAKSSGATVKLSWKTPKDNVGVTGYILKYGDNLEKTLHLSANQLSHQFTNVAPGTFQYQLSAVDAAGNIGKAAVKKTTVKTSSPAYASGTAGMENSPLDLLPGDLYGAPELNVDFSSLQPGCGVPQFDSLALQDLRAFPGSAAPQPGVADSNFSLFGAHKPEGFLA